VHCCCDSLQVSLASRRYAVALTEGSDITIPCTDGTDPDRPTGRCRRSAAPPPAFSLRLKKVAGEPALITMSHDTPACLTLHPAWYPSI
jgi:hypothetical protein